MNPPVAEIIQVVRDWIQNLTESEAVGGIISSPEINREIACLNTVIALLEPSPVRVSPCPSVPVNSGWKNVADEMPDSDLTVLIACTSGNELVWLGYHDGVCWRYADGYRASNVFHWRPLPEPPPFPTQAAAARQARQARRKRTARTNATSTQTK